MNRLLDVTMIALLALAIGYVAAGMHYATKKSCPEIQGNKHISMEVNPDGSYVCKYQPVMWGVAVRVMK